MRRVVPLLLALVLAGCAEESAPAPAEAPPPAARPPLGFSFPCPPGETVERVPGVCAGRIDDPLAQLSEPSLALMPGRPGVMAIGAHATGPMPLLGGAGIEGRVYVTEDGGATWRASTLPLPRGATLFSDPSLAFGADGTLHASGLAIEAGFAARVFAVSSPDLGATWSEPVVVSQTPRNDRNWGSVGPDGAVYVSSHICCGTSRVAWSLDGGATWRSLAEEPEGCYTASPVAFVRGEPWLACFAQDDGIRVFRLDRDAALLEPRGVAGGMGCIAPRILPAPDGAIVLTCYGGLLSRSEDGGATWSAPVAVADVAAVDDGWDSFQVYWSEIDPWGTLHLQLVPFHRPPAHEHLLGRPHRVAHVALDARTFGLVSETRLTPEGPERDLAAPMSLLPMLGDDWYGIAFAEDHGAMVWTYGGAIEWARIEPRAQSM